jgi:hypothetical protein
MLALTSIHGIVKLAQLFHRIFQAPIKGLTSRMLTALQVKERGLTSVPSTWYAVLEWL